MVNIKMRDSAGGYLPLMKYRVFMKSLIVELENSALCCRIYGVSVSPLVTPMTEQLQVQTRVTLTKNSTLYATTADNGGINSAPKRAPS